MLDTGKVSWMMKLFAAASALFGMAAKVRIDDLVLWFLLTGEFIALHKTVSGLWLGTVSLMARHR